MSALSLDIFIYTYNRAGSLARVLEQFAAGPFKHCSLTVLDNCSTDRTPEVCQEFQARLPNLRVVRHPKNIGSNANYLRAIELSQAEYTWAVCDDDDYDFSQAEDLVEALSQRKFDLLSVGVEASGLPGGYEGTALALTQEHPFFIAHSFIPSLIFRTSLFDSSVLQRAYRCSGTVFPQFPLLAHVVERNASLYVSRHTIIRKGSIAGYSAGPFLSGWLECCRRVEDRSIRRKAAAEVFSGKPLLINVGFFILTERALRPERLWPEYRRVCAQAFLFSFWAWLKVLLFFPFAACPKVFHRALWKWYQGYRAKRGLPLPSCDEAR